MDNKCTYTLVTGGSEGIGLELAKLFAQDKHNLILVARDELKLKKAKDDIEAQYKVKVEIVDIDFFVDKTCGKVINFVDNYNLTVDNLVNNAGIGSFGFFYEEYNNFEDDIINVNIIALTKLTKFFLNKMLKQGYGNILNVASTAAFVGGPKMALYYSTKSYVLTLTEAIHEEVKGKGINVSCLCPGPVRTSFQAKSGIKKSEKAKKYIMAPENVAKIGYEGFKKHKAIIIPGFKNKILVLGNKLIPRSISRKIILKTNK